MVGSLSRCLDAWLALPAESWVVEVITSGFRLPWAAGKAPLSPFPITFPPPTSPEAVEALKGEVFSLIQKQAVEEVTSPQSGGFYGRLFVVPKSSGGWRPVLDLSALNRFLDTPRFRMETSVSIRDAIRPMDWAVSIDLKDAYFHIPIYKSDRKYLRFVWQGRVFQYKALPFGLAPAPWVFTRVVREVCAHVRLQGFRLRAYLDDWLLLANSRELCSLQCSQLLSICRRLGFCLNKEKSDLIPSRQFNYLGMAFNTVSGLVSPTLERCQRLSRALDLLLPKPFASARRIASLLGSMESLSLLLPLGRLHKRKLQRLFRSAWSQTSQKWNVQVPLGTAFALAVEKWRDQDWLRQGVPISPPAPQVTIFTDASGFGWGAHSGVLTASGFWEPESIPLHINLLEMEAAFRALRQFAPHLKGKHVLLNSDNTTVCYYLNKQGGARSVPLSQKAESLLLWCEDHSISLTAKFVPGKLNVLADALSRSHMVLQSEWTIAHEVLKPIWAHWETPLVDLFATKFSRRLPLYASPVPDPEAWAIDALAIPWKNFLGYAFPPLPLLGKVLRKAREENASLILVAPFCPAQISFWS